MFDNLINITYLCTISYQKVQLMSKIEMTKKHLITCSVILVLVIISRLNIYSTEPVFTPKIIVNTHSNYIFNHAVNDAEVAYNFANEALPVNDKGVDFKLKNQ